MYKLTEEGKNVRVMTETGDYILANASQSDLKYLYENEGCTEFIEKVQEEDVPAKGIDAKATPEDAGSTFEAPRKKGK